MNKNCFFTLRKMLFNSAFIGTKLFVKQGTAVLCFHSISKSDDRYAIDKSTFTQQMKKISRSSDFVSIDEALNPLSKNHSGVVITFDDGYKDIISITDVVSKYNIKPILFVLAEPEKADRSELENNHQLLSWDEIRKLMQKGFEIGCHTATHKNLTTLSQAELDTEIITAKKVLEKKLKTSIRFFAYPKGLYNESVKLTVSKAGYIGAFSVQPGCIEKDTDMLTLPRTIIDTTHTLAEFPAIYGKSTFFMRKLTNRFKLWERFLAI